jgi:hypothetical protein
MYHVTLNTIFSVARSARPGTILCTGQIRHKIIKIEIA